MSGLHMVYLPLDLKELRQWSAQRALGVDGGKSLRVDEGKALHHLLTETFGKRALHPFRLMVAPRSRKPVATLYAYAHANEEALRQTARETATPEAIGVCNPDRLKTKPMPENWATGRRLAFDVRTRPVRRLHKPAGVFRKGAEVDAFLVEALRRFPEGPPEDDGVERETVYREWLKERLAGAAKVVVDATRLRITRLERRRVQRGERDPDGPDVTFQGELVVTDGAAFAERLAHGVGRHTAFGYGMLLLRPAG